MPLLLIITYYFSAIKYDSVCKINSHNKFTQLFWHVVEVKCDNDIKICQKSLVNKLKPLCV